MADRVPVRVPTLLGTADTDDLTCLLISAAEPLPPPAEWDLARWLEVAGQLGRLHATPVAGEPWLRPLWTPVKSASAREFWQREGLGGLAGDLTGRLGELSAAVEAMPTCLVHGDCHAGNLLTDQGELVWVDWQEVGWGTVPRIWHCSGSAPRPTGHRHLGKRC